MTAISEIQSYLTSSYSSLYDWEYALVAKANEAYHEQDITLEEKRQYQFELDTLNHAYALCDRITAEHSQSFYLASRLLPKQTRRSIRALYAFCRISDDIVDMIPATEIQPKKFAKFRPEKFRTATSIRS